MGYITWSAEQFSVDVDEMDQQHIRWIEIINRLHTSLVNEGPAMSSMQAIKEMIDYTRFHFKQEENLMQEVQYPAREQHIKEHENFLLKLGELEQDITNGNNLLNTQVMSILKNWLVDHICSMDKSYGTFIATSTQH